MIPGRPHLWQRYYNLAWLTSRSFASRRAAAVSASVAGQDDKLQAAREWLAKLNPGTVPRGICEISFSRSSGPGGQNVNKVNSKATIKVPLDSLLPLVPPAIHPPLQSSRYTTQRTNNLLIQSDDSRKRTENIESCYDKLYQLLRSAGQEVVPGETSAEQKDKVRKLQKGANEARIKAKKMHSSKKGSRRGGGNDD